MPIHCQRCRRSSAWWFSPQSSEREGGGEHHPVDWHLAFIAGGRFVDTIEGRQRDDTSPCRVHYRAGGCSKGVSTRRSVDVKPPAAASIDLLTWSAPQGRITSRS